MKKTLLSIALLTASSSAMADQVYNGRLTAMSGAGFVTGDYTDGVLLNPSLGASYGEQDDFALVLNAGALGSDEDELLDGLEEMVDFLDHLSSIKDTQDLDRDLADQAIAHLRGVDGKDANLAAGGSVVLALPGGAASLAFIAKSRIDASVATVVSENDYELIENSIGTSFDPVSLDSGVFTRGAMVTELGVAISKNLPSHDGTQLLVGMTPKHVTVETFIYSTHVDEFDEDDFDAEEYSRESTETNLDAGITYISGNMRYGLVTKDVIEREFDTVTGDKMTTEALSTAAIGYKNGWISAEAAMDLNAVPSFATGTETRMFRAGIELDAWSWLQVRAGMQIDREDTLEDTYSVGVGISPFNTLNVDVSAISGKDGATGGAVQVGLRF